MSTGNLFEDLVAAYDWVSADPGFGNAAYVSRATGRVYWVTGEAGSEDELPDDLDDGTQYIAVVHRRSLDLGFPLALRFVEAAIPDQYDRASGFFHHPGAYRKFKAMLEREGMLEAWYAYEADAVESTLRDWVAENNLPITDGAGPGEGSPGGPTSDARLEGGKPRRPRMTIQLDHFIVPSRNQTAAAKLLGELLGVAWAESGVGPFAPVYVNDGLTLDFIETEEVFPVHHYCFRVGQEEFDAILGRIEAAGIAYRSTVRGPVERQVSAEYGNIYWNEPDGHQWEILTVSYARQAQSGAA